MITLFWLRAAGSARSQRGKIRSAMERPASLTNCRLVSSSMNKDQSGVLLANIVIRTAQEGCRDVACRPLHPNLTAEGYTVRSLVNGNCVMKIFVGPELRLLLWMLIGAYASVHATGPLKAADS